MTVQQRIRGLQQSLPLIAPEHARFMHARASDLNKRGAKVLVWAVLWSDDARVSLHKTLFEKSRPMSVPEWALWLEVHAPHVFRNSVLASINRSYGSTWNIDRVFGWQFVGETTAGKKGKGKS